jgi:KTSC domain
MVPEAFRQNEQNRDGPDVSSSQSILSLVRRLLEMGLRLCPLRRAARYQATPSKGYIQIRSLGYDRRRGRLEIEFTWMDDVRQIYPVSPTVYRQLLPANPMYLFLNQILKPRGVRFQYVRTEAKRAIMMAGIASK